MKRLITLCIVLTAVALVSAPAFAEVQNVKVSGDVNTTAIYRENYSLKNDVSRGASTDEHENGLVTNARVRIDADLTDNVSATVRLLSEYYWDTYDHAGRDSSSSDGDGVDLDIASVTLKEAFYAPLTVIVGRQPLRYGNAFVIGDPDTNTTSAEADVGSYTDLSLRKSFDAIRAILDYNPWTIDLIYSKIDETGTTKRDVDLYGVNAAYQFDTYDAELEAYVFVLRDDTNSSPAPGTQGVRNNLRPGNEINTYGVRGSMELMDNLNVLGEVAFQRGDYDTATTGTKRDQDAYAYQIAGEYTLATEWPSAIRAGFTHYEGEERGNSGDHEGWIPLFEDQSHGVVANYILGGVNGGQNSNADILNLGLTCEPLEDLTLSVDYYGFWLDEKLVNADNDAASNHGGLGWYNLTESSTYMAADDNLGYEIDVALNYDYTEDVKMGFLFGYFAPGDAFEGTSSNNENDENAVQVLATLDVAF